MEYDIIDQLRRELYCGQDPYSRADESALDRGYPHSSLGPDLVAAILQTVHPAFWLEVGSMLGHSAILTADTISHRNYATQVVCIDPFCGDVNMWAWEAASVRDGTWRFLRIEEGQPTIYRRFLANVRHSGYHHAMPSCPSPVLPRLGSPSCAGFTPNNACPIFPRSFTLIPPIWSGKHSWNSGRHGRSFCPGAYFSETIGHGTPFATTSQCLEPPRRSMVMNRPELLR